jgi:hypothetical protein
LEYDISAPQEHKNLPLTEQVDCALCNEAGGGWEARGDLGGDGGDMTNAIMSVEEEVLMEAFIHRVTSALHARHYTRGRDSE